MEAVRKVHAARMRYVGDCRPDPPIVWIHDYQLMLAANAIRYFNNIVETISSLIRFNF